jgi:hypothetical protein
MIQVFRKGSGPWPEYDVDGVVVSVTCHGSSLVIDCAERQTDARVTIDLVHGSEGSLVEGAASGESYVATLEIPPAKYAAVPEAPEPADEEGNGEMMESGAGRERLPLTEADMVAVVLHLWTIPDICRGQEGV